MLVVDASVPAPALQTTGQTAALRARLRGQSLVPPELIDLDATSVIRRRLQVAHLDARRAGLDVVLVTADARIANATGPRCQVQALY